MLYLSETPDANVDYREIVERVLGSKSAATQALEQLEEMGLVGRQRQPKDRRKAFVSLTDKGRELVVALEAA
jgi:MarR family transcriptional regulator, organic hydroperoxide resistance regulator